ncbi:hypothetical protein [Qipengyuania vesicularis]|nr:hypothetical protein [Qipengyuania vesicularis]
MKGELVSSSTEGEDLSKRIGLSSGIGNDGWLPPSAKEPEQDQG